MLVTNDISNKSHYTSMVCVCVRFCTCYGPIICCSDVGMDVIGQCLCLSQVPCNTAVAEHMSILENKIMLAVRTMSTDSENVSTMVE